VFTPSQAIKMQKSSYAPGFINVSLIVAAALTLIIVMHMKWKNTWLRVSTANTGKEK
jgi:hypothetical protein